MAGPSAPGAGQSDLLRALIEQGLPVLMRVHGLSMMPSIRDDDVVTIVPLAGRDPSVGDVVAFTLPAGGKLALHRVISREETGWLLRGDNRGESDGLVAREYILGSVARVERRGRDVAFGTGIARTGVAWASRRGVLHRLIAVRGRLRWAASLVALGAQGFSVYRAAARRLLGRIEVEEADQADTRTFRLRHCATETEPQQLRARGRAVSTWVARRRGKVVGLADLLEVEDPDSPWAGLWLSSLTVRTRYRGRGAGEALVLRAAAKASGRGGRSLSLAVFEGDAAAISLFRRLGFAPVVASSLEPALDAEEQLLDRRPMVMREPLESWAEDQSLSAELRVLLLCARAVMEPWRSPAFYAALAECSDAGLLCETAIQQGMLGHLHSMVSKWQASGQPAAPGGSGLLQRLTELQRIASQRSLRQTAQLLRLIDQLREVGVDAMPYKGPVWAQCLYGDVTLRTWEDLDLIARHEQLPLLREVLLKNGFVDANPFNARVLERRQRGWGEIAFATENSGLYLDVHWNVTVGFSPGSLPADRLLDRSGSTCLLGRPVVSPSTIDTLIIACVNGTKDRWNSIEGLLGLGVQVLALPAARWADALSVARSARCHRRTIVGVAHACQVFGLEPPQEVARAVARDAASRALLRSLVPGTLDRGRSAEARTELARLTWRFATEDSLAASMWHATTRFFRPGPEDWDWLSVPAGMSWLHRLLRPARLAVKWAKRL